METTNCFREKNLGTALFQFFVYLVVLIKELLFRFVECVAAAFVVLDVVVVVVAVLIGCS